MRRWHDPFPSRFLLFCKAEEKIALCRNADESTNMNRHEVSNQIQGLDVVSVIFLNPRSITVDVRRRRPLCDFFLLSVNVPFDQTDVPPSSFRFYGYQEKNQGTKAETRKEAECGLSYARVCPNPKPSVFRMWSGISPPEVMFTAE